MRLGLRQLSSSRCCDYGGCKPSGFSFQPSYAPSYPPSYPLAEGYADLRFLSARPASLTSCRSDSSFPLRPDTPRPPDELTGRRQDKEQQRKLDKESNCQQGLSSEKRGTSFLSCFGL
eukprot:764075-Hanusia_phi.AAC.4